MVVLPKFGYDYELFKTDTCIYSDVVDKSNYTVVDNAKKAASAGFDSGASPGLYDFDEKGYDRIKDPDQLVIMIRDGKLDRAEVEKARQILQQQAEQEIQAAAQDKKAKKLQKMYETQLEVIDSYLNFKSDTEADSTNLLTTASK